MNIKMETIWLPGIVAFLIVLFEGTDCLKCYNCDNEHSNFLCNSEFNLVDCDVGMDTCQTIVGYSDVSEKLSIIKTCTKNESCLLQTLETRDTPCDLDNSNWICTYCCHGEACNVNQGNTLTKSTFYNSIFVLMTKYILNNLI